MVTMTATARTMAPTMHKHTEQQAHSMKRGNGARLKAPKAARLKAPKAKLIMLSRTTMMRTRMGMRTTATLRWFVAHTLLVVLLPHTHTHTHTADSLLKHTDSIYIEMSS